MANHKSAAKRARQTVKRNEQNRASRAKVRSLTKAAEKAIVGKVEPKAALTTLRSAESGLARAARKGVMHPRTAARKTSRLARAVKKVALAKGKA